MTFELRLESFAPPTYRKRAVIDVIANTEGRLVISQDGKVIFAEDLFPVVELARALDRWLKVSSSEDFVFDSMSFQDPGAVCILRSEKGWVLTSVFAQGLAVVPEPLAAIHACVTAFVGRICHELDISGWECRSVLGEPFANEQ